MLMLLISHFTPSPILPSSPLPATLPYLFQASFLLDEGLAPLILQLIHTALSGLPSKAAEAKEQPKKDSGGKETKDKTAGEEGQKGKAAGDTEQKAKGAGEEGQKAKEKEKEKEEEGKESTKSPPTPGMSWVVVSSC